MATDGTFFPTPKTLVNDHQQDITPTTEFHSRVNGPLHAERHMRVICIGAGASGLLFAYKLQRSFKNFTLTVYEKNPEVAGTWYENKYPGCACDVPSHNYTWSFEPKLDWSGVYAKAGEIFDYFDGFSKKYHLDQYCKTQHQVSGARWNAAKNGWDVQVTNLVNGEISNDFCDIFINAGGYLNAWRWPAIPGLKNYEGKLLHTAAWDSSVDLSDKVVGLIGNGSSGIQVLPAIQKIVKKCITFIREPTWVSPVQGLEDHVYSAKEIEEFANEPGVLLQYRKNIERGLNGQFGIFLQDSQVQRNTRAHMLSQMKEKLGNKELEAKLIPDWAVGCRRLTPGVNYLENLTAPNVEVVYGEIKSVSEKGCICDNGQEYPVDVLICATGFDTSFKPRFPLIGPTGSLADAWKDDAKGYMGLAAPDFPNYLVFLGPNCPVGNGPLLCAIEAQADYMLKVIDRWQIENIASFAPKMEAVEDFIAFTDQFMKKTVWHEECRSWYKNNSASSRVTALWPGSTLHYIEAMKEVRWDDWDIKYQGNRFSWLGNGYSQTEIDNTADWAYYIRERDDGPFLSRGKQRKIENKSGKVTAQAGFSFLSAKAELKI